MTREGPQWKAPLDADGAARATALHQALEVAMPQLENLLAELQAGVSCAEWGFLQLAEIHDVEQRALLSDQLVTAAEGVQDALVDAGISALEVELYTGPNGLPYSDRHASLDDMLRYQRLRRAVTSFFLSVGTALDCLAAVLIVVTRAPLSVQRADHTQLADLDPSKAYANAFAGPVPQHQRDLWTALLSEMQQAAGTGPVDWLTWSLEMRNALTHRGRITNVYLPRRVSGQLLVPPTNVPQSNRRYDLHLRSRPWLPGLEQMLAGPALPDSWLNEPAGRTVTGLRDELLRYCERLAAWAHTKWVKHPEPSLAIPVGRWVLPPPPLVEFKGVKPGGTEQVVAAIGGVHDEQLRLAERLRRRRAGLPDLGAASGRVGPGASA